MYFLKKINSFSNLLSNIKHQTPVWRCRGKLSIQEEHVYMVA